MISFYLLARVYGNKEGMKPIKTKCIRLRVVRGKFSS